MLMYLGLGVFVSLGGLEALYLSLASTFERVPPGGFGLGMLPLDAIVGVVASGFELAIRVAAPAVCIIVLIMIAMGFVMKSMPQINVLSIGFTVKIIGGLLMVTLSLGGAAGGGG
jgi:flagellar biosynthetic protein FliR